MTGINSHRKSESGFSLIELLIVVAIIGIIAAISIPYFERAKQPANAASAISSLRMIHSAQVSHRTLRGVYTNLSTLYTSGFLNDGRLSNGHKSNYLFTVSLGADAAASYETTATPLYQPTLSSHYFTDATGVIRTADGVAATAASSPLN